MFRPEFFHSQFRLIWVSAAAILVSAVGMTLVIVARQIDISIGSQFSVCGIVVASLAAARVPAPGVLLGALAAGAGMGAVNGVLVAGLGLPSIVATLATMAIISGVLTWVTQGAAVSFPGTFQWFGASQEMGQAIILAAALLVFVFFCAAMRWLSAGRAVYAVGSDQEAARLAGMRPRWVVFWVFVVMGALMGVAALINTAQYILVFPAAGKNMEFAVIAAVVVGGTAVSGGRGTLIGTLIGVALLATIGPALSAFGVSSHWTMAVQGAIILLAVAGDGLQRRTR
jgi:rhamnose transport system permease protein